MNWIMRCRVSMLVGLVIALAACTAGHRLGRSVDRLRHMHVVVVGPSEHTHVAGARVFFLTRDGRELSVVRTDSQGRAEIQLPRPNDGVQWILTEAPGRYVSGASFQWTEKDESEFAESVTADPVFAASVHEVSAMIVVSIPIPPGWE